MAELIKSKSKRDTFLLHLGGFLYYKNGGKVGATAYWKCRRTPACGARLTTLGDAENLRIKKGTVNDHEHPPNPEEVAAEKIVSGIKRKAADHPEMAPSGIVRNAVRGVGDGVLAQLPERLNLRKGVARVRLRNVPSNPTRIEDLKAIPTNFRNSLAGEAFLLYDSYKPEEENDDSDSDSGSDSDDDDNEGGRILIYATPTNLRNLFESDIWFVDGTFKCAPSIFFQLFAIMGAVTQVSAKGTHTIGVPFVYALLQNKTQVVYEKVFKMIKKRAEDLHIHVKMPSIVMSDFELAIINAVKAEFGADKIRCCLFHLGKSVYRHVQSTGLQQQYADPNDPSIRDAARSLVALSFLPPEDIPKHFQSMHNQIPEDFQDVYNYFGTTYVTGRASRGRGRGRQARTQAIPPRYDPILWSHYHSVLQGTARTNNISEGWHNRLQVLMGKDHPSFYAFIVELKKEQADSEIILRQLQLGQKVRKGQDPSRKKKEERILNIVSKYNEYQSNDDVQTYLSALSHNVHM